MNDSIKRIFLGDEELENLNKTQLIEYFKCQNAYINKLEENDKKLRDLDENKTLEIWVTKAFPLKFGDFKIIL